MARAEDRATNGAVYAALDARCPLVLGDVTVTSIGFDGTAVILRGTGGGIDWPIRVVDAPVHVLTGDGMARHDPLGCVAVFVEQARP